MEMTKLILKISVKGNKSYYYNLLRFLSLVPPYTGLTPNEMKVMSLLLSKYQEKSYLPEKDRHTIVFSRDMRREYREDIKISKENLDNIMSSLRKKGFITYGKVVDKFKLNRSKIGDEVLIKFIDIK
ncbi:hypothetical protein KKH23_07140 [Patescibacteria group bacterium]|nr:hypothetical protein [Patescibacteria group bacterium]